MKGNSAQIDDHVREDFPVVVSFFGGDEYYHRAADRLRGDCEALGLRHHVEQRDVEGMSWPEICREKIKFFGQMREQFGSFLWTDVDNRLLAVPEVLAGNRADFGGFIGRRQYLRDYDPYDVARFWIPSVLFFGAAEVTGRFIAALGEREASTEEDVTDDWVLQETWRTFPERMNLLVMSPDLLTRDGDEQETRAAFHLGDSGNVSEYRGKVAQHSPKGSDFVLRGRMLAAESKDAMRAGEKGDALVLAEHAHQRLPDDSEAVLRYANYLTTAGEGERADQVLRDFVAHRPDELAVRDALVRRLSRRGDHVAAAAEIDALRRDEDPRAVARGNALDYEVRLDRAAQENEEDDRARPSVWWARSPAPGHFVEVLKPWIIDQLLPGTPKFGRRQRALLTGEGALTTTTAGNVVWGGGIRSADERPSADATFLAVRGPRTRRAVIAAGGHCPELYGDPVQLMPEVLPRDRPKRRKHYLGLLRGPGDLSMDVSLDGVHEIDAIGTPPTVIEHVVEEILHCRGLLTTSVAGLVTAHAYGVPARWCVFGDNHRNRQSDGEEFRDYFAAAGLVPQEPLDLSSIPVLSRDLLRQVPLLGTRPVPDPNFAEALIRHFERDGSSDE